MDESIYRKQSMERINSPEALNDYLRVTNPAVWMILIAVILLLAGMLVWSTSATIDSYATGTAVVEGGTMQVYFDDAKMAESVGPGMTVIVGTTEVKITSVGADASGRRFAHCLTTLADGTYPAKVLLRQTQVIRLLFN